MSDYENYVDKYNKYIIDQVSYFTAYRFLKAMKEETGDDTLYLTRQYDKPGVTRNYLGINILAIPNYSKVFLEIDFGPGLNYREKCNLDNVWDSIIYEFNQDFRQEIIANLDVGSIDYDYGDVGDPDTPGAPDTFDGGEGPDRTGQTGTMPDFRNEYYFWTENREPETFQELYKARLKHTMKGETHMWPEITLRNRNISKNVDSRPYISLWTVGYWKSLTGEYEFIEDRALFDSFIGKLYVQYDDEDVIRSKYNTLRLGLDDIIDNYNMRGDDFDRNVIPDAYADYQVLLNSTFGASYEFIDASEKVFYKLTSRREENEW